MIVKNEYVKLKMDKEYVLHNYIYDDYLKLFSKAQLIDENGNIYINDVWKKDLTDCYIKFDSPLNNHKNAKYNEFDISIGRIQRQKNGNSKGCNVIYIYSNQDTVLSIEDNTIIKSLEEFYDKKITAIGFGNGNNIYACVDTSNYSIYLTKDMPFMVIRKDIFKSDAECIGYDYPYHLSPTDVGWFSEEYVDSDTGQIITETYKAPIVAMLYSIGTGTQKGVMYEEYIIGKDIDIKRESDTVFGFNLRTGLEESVFPHSNLYTGSGKYPMPQNYIKEIFLNSNLQPGSNRYPLKTNTKYIIFKYRFVHQYNSIHSQEPILVKTNDYYTMNYYTEVKGLFEIKNKIERND